MYHAGDAAPPNAPEANAAIGAAAGAIGAFYVLAIVGTIAMPPWLALIVAQAALAVVALSLAGPRRVGVVPPRARFVVAAVLVGASTWFLNILLDDALGLTETGGRLEHAITDPPLAVVLVTLAALPAVCEELAFRGVLARGLATRLPWWGAALASSAAFSAYHLSLAQMLPTFTLGLALATIAIRGNSVVPSMIAHAINNVAAIVLSRPEGASGNAWIGDHVMVVAPVAALLCAGGVALAATGAPSP
nr:CPBP family intramembrane glutamic endopeptidase [Kofleriaceae bacterium]